LETRLTIHQPDPALWLHSHSLSTLRRGGEVGSILSAALQAVDPAVAVARFVTRSADKLSIADRVYDLKKIRYIWLVGAGKAGAPMASAIYEILGDELAQGIVIVKEGYAGHFSRPDGFSQTSRVLSILEAGHPVPDERGVQGAMRIGDLLRGAQADDLVICLISGGGSALLVSPVSGVSLEDLQHLTATLLACGADIYEINTLRKHLEQLKGGGLARLSAPAQVVSLVLSDVIGDPLEVIASGPTAPDPSTFQDAWNILERYNMVSRTPTAIRNYLEQGLQGLNPETPKPGDKLFDHTHNVIIGSNLQAAQAALAQAQACGYNTLLLTTALQGEARQAGRFLAAVGRQIAVTGQPLPRPACLVVGGETTVTLQGSGLGGRNQELALGAVADLAGLADTALITLATDGGDGPTDAAGAIVTGETQERAHQMGLYPDSFLARNDAYHFFEALDDLLKPGPTLTNVNDLAFVFAF
jgi:glycerate 2-kinase